MCGINGLLRLTHEAPLLDRGELLRTRDAMAARGPDGAGLWLSPSGQIGMAHRRLAILDLSEAGAQPMVSADGRYAVVFNGAIYNFRELRAELQAQGDTCRSRGDTEVLLALFAREGAAMLGRLRGMFAIALWDERERRLLLARDTFGIKPLYYSSDGRTFRFASQVKALVAAGVPRDVDPVGVAGFLLWGSVPEPWTIHRAVRAVPSGSWLEVRDGHVGAPVPLDPYPTDPVGVEEALVNSVGAHLVSDVPVGVFLSSGLDSALVTALAQRQAGSCLRSFTLAFDAFRGTDLDEAPGAAALARAVGTDHTERWVTAGEVEAAWPQALAAMDQPSIDGFNVYLVSRFAREAGLKVVLSGLGGDELFGSYPSFRDVPRWHRWARAGASVPGLRAIWRALAPVLRGRPKLRSFLEHGRTLEGAYLLRRGMFLPEDLPDLLGASAARDAIESYAPLAHLRSGQAEVRPGDWERVQGFETRHYLRNQLLRDADWASMAHSLELRVPLVDVALHAALARASFEPARSSGKSALVRQIAPELPTSLLERTKSGFMVPTRAGGSAPGGWGQRARRLAREVLRQFGVELAPSPGERGGTLFLLTEAFHRPGGIQTHNRTQLQALVRCLPDEPLTALALNDTEEDVDKPEWQGLRRRAYSRVRWRFALGSMAAVWRQQPHRVILGHRNFLPLAPLFRPLAPGAQRWLLTYGIEAQPRLTGLEWFCLASCERVFAISPYTSETFTAAGCQQRIDLWPCSLPHDWPLPEPVPPRLAPPYRLLTVSRLAPPDRYKGIDDVIRATARLRAAGLDVRLDIVGDGEDRGRLERLADTARVGSWVTFHGSLDDTRLRARYAACDAFVLPSGAEGFGIVYLEAMAFARPVVAADAGGTPFVVRPGESGWLIPYGRPDLLSACLKGVLQQADQARRTALQGRQWLEARFSFEQATRFTREVCLRP